MRSGENARCLSNLERVSCAGSHGLRDCAGNEGIGRGNLCLSLEEVPLQQVVDDKPGSSSSRDFYIIPAVECQIIKDYTLPVPGLVVKHD